jgi:hypothetical protein
MFSNSNSQFFYPKGNNNCQENKRKAQHTVDNEVKNKEVKEKIQKTALKEEKDKKTAYGQLFLAVDRHIIDPPPYEVDDLKPVEDAFNYYRKNR